MEKETIEKIKGTGDFRTGEMTEEVEARLTFPSKGKSKQVRFDQTPLRKELVEDPVMDEVERAELYNMYHATFELDDGHTAYLFIPKDYFDN